MGMVMSLIFTLWITYLAIYFTNVINRKAWRERGKWGVIKWQSLITIAMILCLIVALIVASVK